ncbi:MAG: hypothetical protein H6600_05825 [Flavobacteriales bacterium]|nr:hypothetical protein [Flavobacteriales bacterium]MCB9197960.1 hypothetical protein [Flavobacteriales bacterium]
MKPSVSSDGFFMSKKKLATDLEEDWMKGACWMGGEPEKVRELLSEYQYSRSFLEHCIELVMNSHSCRTTYAWALDCKG